MRTVPRLIPLLLVFAALPLHATITGSVMNSDGQPIAGAKVLVFGPETLSARRERLASKTPDHTPLVSATADSNGNFRVEPPKDVTIVDLRVDAPGYAPDSMRMQSDDEAGAVVLTKAESKSGTVRANGKAVAGATVILQSGTSGFITTTDDKGKYTVPDPSKWANLMIIIHPDYARSTEALQFAKKDLDRTLVSGVKVAGKVVGGDGTTGVADAVIDIDGWPAGKSGADGTFSFDHAPKNWTEIRAVKGSQIAARANSAGALTLKLAKGATITGSVRDIKTQMPLAGAEVQIALGMPRFGPAAGGAGGFMSAQTDAKGNFTLSPLAAGSYMLNPSRPNFMIPNASVQIAAGQAQSKPFFATAMARVSGTVIDEDKRPVAAARVAAERAGRNADMFMIRPGMVMGGRTAFSGPDGRFVARVTDLDADVHVGAVKKGYPATKSSIMRLSSGERKSGLTLVIPRGIAFTGRVTDKGGKPVSGVSVDAAESQGDMFGAGVRRMVVSAMRGGNEENVTTAADGTFTVRLKEGKYDVVFKREGFATKVLRAQQVAANEKPVTVALEPGVEVTGRVVRGGVGVDGVNVNAMSDGGAVSAMTGPDGSFTLSDLTPGQMMLMANKPDGMIQEMRQVTAPAQNVTIEVPVGGRITGRVVDKATHSPISSFQAGVTASRGGGGMVIMMPPMLKPFTSDDGTFVLDNVKPGPVQVVAMAAGYTTGRAPTVEVEDGKTISDVEVPLETGAKLVGRVTDTNGAPIAGVSVRPDMMGGGRMMRFDATEVSGSTDPNGEYAIDGIEPGEKTFNFTRSGYVEESKTFTVAAGKDNRLDVTMGSGLRLSGQVVLEGGAPVADATVRASSAAGGFREAHTDAGGTFQLDGLTPGHYNFTATKVGLANGISRDVDIAAQNNIRIVMKGGGTITGHITGLTDHDLEQTTVSASSANGAASAPVDANGNYRIDGAPNGTVRVSARTGAMMVGGSRSAPPKTIELEPGGSAQVDIEFKSDTVIRGRVTLNNQPLSNVNVNFMPRQGKTQTASSAPADANGNYQIVGLEDGPYNVAVMDMKSLTPYTTTYEVHGSGNFDIDMHTAPVRGRVVDAATGEPIDRATVELRPQGDAPFFSSRPAATDSTGRFIIENVPQGTYQASAVKDDYGQQSKQVMVGDTTDEVEFKLVSSSGVTLNVVDGRDGRMLNANVSVADMQGNPISGDGPIFRGMSGGGGEPVKLSLAAGTYRVTVNAMNYARRTLVVSSPSTQRVELTPGGTLLIHSKGSGLRYRLVDANGIPYLGMGSMNAFPLLDGTTTVQNVATGHYRLDVLDRNDRVIKSIDVDVVEGQPADYSV